MLEVVLESPSCTILDLLLRELQQPSEEGLLTVAVELVEEVGYGCVEYAVGVELHLVVVLQVQLTRKASHNFLEKTVDSADSEVTVVVEDAGQERLRLAAYLHIA